MSNGLAARRIQELYNELPAIDCKGKCHHSCQGVQLSHVEADRIRKLTQPITGGTLFLGTPEGVRCPLLNIATKQCGVYKRRPMICRLWGVTERMACPHGCKPERLLTDLEEYRYINEAMYIGGSYDQAMYDENREWMADPEFFAIVQQAMRRDNGMTFERAREWINRIKTDRRERALTS